MLRFGDVKEADYATGRYRVYFPLDDTVSFPLPLVAFSVDNAKPHTPLAVGTQVACLVDGIEGVILGAVYTDVNSPEQGLGADDFAVTFDGGARMSWDGSAFKMELSTASIELGPEGIKIARGGDTLKAVISELLTALTTTTHLSAAPGAPTGPPINLATFTALKTRAELLLN